MSNVAQAWAWSVKGLKGSEKLVLIRLADHANADGFCWPGKDSIAETCCIGKRTVDAAISALVDRKLISIIPRTKDGFSLSNAYQLHLGQGDLFDSQEPEKPKGCKSRRPADLVAQGVQILHDRGANFAPEPSIEPSIEPSLADSAAGAAASMDKWNQLRGAELGIRESHIDRLHKAHGVERTHRALIVTGKAAPKRPAEYLAAVLQARPENEPLPADLNQWSAWAERTGNPEPNRGESADEYKHRLRATRQRRLRETADHAGAVAR